MELRTIGQVGVFAIEHGTSYEDGPDLLRLRIRIGDAVLRPARVVVAEERGEE